MRRRVEIRCDPVKMGKARLRRALPLVRDGRASWLPGMEGAAGADRHSHG
jgi:hypothetical protein